MDANQLTILITAVIGSGGISSGMTTWLNRNKYKAEAQDTIGKTYGGLIDSCQRQLDRQELRLNHQAEEIKALQDREVGYLRIISGHQETERELRSQIRSLENKLSKRLNKLEQQTEV